ncbi:MAG: DJ-1/PfpI family protein [Cuniculiplasma sp.]
MKKVGIIIDDGFHDLELWLPYYRFKEEGVDFDILAWEDRDYKGVYGLDSIKPTQLLGDGNIDYDLIYIPGAKSPENLLKHPGTTDLIKSMSSGGMIFATICHGPLLLGEAGLLNGMEITGHPSIEKDLVKWHAKYVDSPVVRSSRNIISGKTHFQFAQFMPEILKIIKE